MSPGRTGKTLEKHPAEADWETPARGESGAI